MAPARTIHLQKGAGSRGGQRLRLLLMQYFAAFAFRAALTIKSFMHAFSTFSAFSVLSHFAFFTSRFLHSAGQRNFMLFENLLNYDNHNALASPVGTEERQRGRGTSTNNNKQVEFSRAGAAAVAGARTR